MAPPRASNEPRQRSPPVAPLVLGTDVASERHVVIPPSADRFHAAVFGSTGAGKSMLAHSVALQQIVNRGGGVGVIDPHADLAFGILSYLVAHGYFRDPTAFDSLVYIDFSEDAFLPFNVLRQPHLSAYATAETVMEALVRTFPDLEGGAPLFRTLFLASAVTLIANGLPLTCLYPLLIDIDFRHRCLQKVTDPLVLQTFAHYDRARGGVEAQAGSALRRAFLLTFSPIARFTLGQTENRLDMRSFMDSGRSLLLNLGSIPDSRTQRLLSSLSMTFLEQAALSRAQLPPQARKPWLCLVDEWPVVCARQPETLGRILETSRKYGLILWLLGQHAGQLTAARLSGALEQARTTILFRLGPESAGALAPHVASIDPYRVKSPARTLSQRDIYMSAGEQRAQWEQRLQELPVRQAVVKIHGQETTQLRTLAVATTAPDPDELAEVLAEYHRRYQRSRSEAEATTMQVLERAGVSPGILSSTPYGSTTPDTDTLLDFDAFFGEDPVADARSID